MAKFSGCKQALWLRHKFYDLNELNNIYFSLAEVYHKDSVKYVWKRNMTYQSKNIQSIISQEIHSVDTEGTAMSKTVTALVFTCLRSWLGENTQLANTLQTVRNTERNKSAGVGQIILVHWEEGLIEKVTFQQRLTGSESKPCNYLGKGCPRQKVQSVQRPCGINNLGLSVEW